MHRFSVAVPICPNSVMTNKPDPIYLHLKPGAEPIDISALSPYLAVIVIEADVTPEWRSMISKWLANSGCLCMLAWGPECSLWDDAVDWANIEQFDYMPIPDDSFILTYWFSDDNVEDVFEFAKFTVKHPTVELMHTVLLHISNQNDEAILLQKYADT